MGKTGLKEKLKLKTILSESTVHWYNSSQERIPFQVLPFTGADRRSEKMKVLI